ncbi:HAD family hydrolase [candidate division KSB1 bacterium]|nr:HAD family hydrolase [candidate division KSB1 bacterium]
MKDIQAIFFDFDGVILESVDAKAWAFEKLFDEYPQYVDDIVSFHYANGGMSRFDKFRYIYKSILKQPLSEVQFKQLCDDFSDLVYNRVLECDFVSGAREFLDNYYKKMSLFIISGTPQDEMVKIVNEKGLCQYFQGIYGSPTPKGVWLKRIIEERCLDPTKCIFVGDATSDYNAARENDLFFVLRVTDSNYDIFKDKKVDLEISDLFELESYISQGGN